MITVKVNRCNPQMITLGRDSRGLSLTALSKKLKISRATLLEYERGGAREISEEHLERIAKALGYPTSFLDQWEPISGFWSVCTRINHPL